MEVLIVIVFGIVMLIWAASGEYDADGSIQAGKRARRKRHRDGGMK